jgi:hypothetical protein
MGVDRSSLVCHDQIFLRLTGGPRHIRLIFEPTGMRADQIHTALFSEYLRNGYSLPVDRTESASIQLI